MQQTIYWWNKLGPALESEFKVKDKSYIKSLTIFFNELIKKLYIKTLQLKNLKIKDSQKVMIKWIQHFIIYMLIF